MQHGHHAQGQQGQRPGRRLGDAPWRHGRRRPRRHVLVGFLAQHRHVVADVGDHHRVGAAALVLHFVQGALFHVPGGEVDLGVEAQAVAEAHGAQPGAVTAPAVHRAHAVAGDQHFFRRLAARREGADFLHHFRRQPRSRQGLRHRAAVAVGAWRAPGAVPAQRQRRGIGGHARVGGRQGRSFHVRARCGQPGQRVGRGAAGRRGRRLGALGPLEDARADHRCGRQRGAQRQPRQPAGPRHARGGGRRGVRQAPQQSFPPALRIQAAVTVDGAKGAGPAVQRMAVQALDGAAAIGAAVAVGQCFTVGVQGHGLHQPSPADPDGRPAHHCNAPGPGRD